VKNIKSARDMAGVLCDAVYYSEYASHSAVEERSIDYSHVGCWVRIVFGTREKDRTHR